MNKDLATISHQSGQLAFHNQDAITIEKWKARQGKIGRFEVPLPDLKAGVASHHELAPSINERIDKFEKDRGGLAKSSMRMLSTVLKSWLLFCELRGIPAFPQVNSNAVEIYLMGLIESDKSIATVVQYRNQLRYFYNYLLIFNPANTPDVSSIIKSLKTDQVEITGESYQQTQATPLRRSHLNFLLDKHDALDERVTYQLNITQRKAIAIATTLYATCLREDEICRIKLKHLKFVHDKNGDIAVKVSRTRSKTGVGVRSKWVTGRYAVTLQRYFNIVSPVLHENDFLFSNVSNSLKPLTPQTPPSGSTIVRNLNKLFHQLKQILEEKGIEDAIINRKAWTGHSGRVGKIIDLYQLDKMRIPDIQLVGDWKNSEMVNLYLREVIEQEELENNIPE
ncbi:tyrosine-type recombinase/integrase [Vibrio splendidus]|uniref:tyrosine-type recombinase/integrase n=1 Tax=Vibrio splendidus TaxID=29497 RepID=UPI00352D3606